MRAPGPSEPPPPRERWEEPSIARRYARERFAGAARRSRDGRLVASLLRRFPPRCDAPLVLDAPCGAGRMLASLAAHAEVIVALDASAAMLAEARAAGARRLVRGDLVRLPFADRAFDLVLCCRLLHHLADGGALERCVHELVRVSRDLVVASFWDANSLAARRHRRRGWRDARRPVTRERLHALFAEAGAEVLGHASAIPRVTQQTFLAARRPPPKG